MDRVTGVSLMESDVERFSRLVTPEIEGLLRAAKALTRDAHEAEDVAQETLIRAFKSICGFDGAHPRAWLLTILRNTHINRNRKRRPLRAIGGGKEGEKEITRADERPGPLDLAERADLLAVTLRLIEGLGAEQREVIELVDLMGYSYAEAAGKLGVAKGTVMSRLHRGRASLRSGLVEAGVI